MFITHLHIENFKGYQELDLPLQNGVNVLVGDNESKKTTILEAINLVLTGYIDGIYLTKEKLNQYLFNYTVFAEYLEKIKNGQIIDPPIIRIELFFSDDVSSDFAGANNYKISKSAKGIFLQISMREEYRNHYNELLSHKELIESIPLELYDIELTQFSGNSQARLTLPIKSILVDAASNFQDVSELMIARKIKSDLDSKDKLLAAQEHRKLKESFKKAPIHSKLSESIDDENITVSIDPSAKNSWDAHLAIFFKSIPFGYVGKGRQAMIKTLFALGTKKAIDSALILIEEPENHLSHTNLNALINEIEANCANKQLLITSHSSFVANKLGLEKLILLSEANPIPFKNLSSDAIIFFKKLPGYDTLRLLLCKKAFLVEGDADELLVQRAFMDTHDDRLPIQKGIEVISVNNSFRNYLEIGKFLEKKIAVLIDVDDKVEDRKKLKEEFSKNEKVEIFFEENDPYTGSIKDYNNNTLEPLLLKYNDLKTLSEIFDFNNTNSINDDLLIHMRKNKTKCALKIFEAQKKISYPKYITDAINFLS